MSIKNWNRMPNMFYTINPFFLNTIGFCLFQLGSNLSHFGSISSFEDVGGWYAPASNILHTRLLHIVLKMEKGCVKINMSMIISKAKIVIYLMFFPFFSPGFFMTIFLWEKRSNIIGCDLWNISQYNIFY